MIHMDMLQEIVFLKKYDPYLMLFQMKNCPYFGMDEKNLF